MWQSCLYLLDKYRGTESSYTLKVVYQVQKINKFFYENWYSYKNLEPDSFKIYRVIAFKRYNHLKSTEI